MDEESKIPTAVLKEFLHIALQSAPSLRHLLVMLSYDKADSEIRFSHKHALLSCNDFISASPLPVASACLSPFGGR